MKNSTISMSAYANEQLSAFLDERIYEYNASTTGIHDGQLMWAAIQDDGGSTIAAIYGHTWGECCEITRLWVAESHRHKGFGKYFLREAEVEARRRSCVQLVLTTHSFQAAELYERLGFHFLAEVPEYPKGHTNMIYLKKLC